MSARRCADLCSGCRNCLTYSVSAASGECLWAQLCTIGRDARFAAQRLTHAAELPAPGEGWAAAAGALFSTVLLKARELRHLQAAKGVGNGAAAGKGKGSGGGGAAAGKGKGKGGGPGVTLKVRGMGKYP